VVPDALSEDQEKRFVLPMPASKWDEFDESEDANASLQSNSEPAPVAEYGEKSSSRENTTKVPLEVIRSAENFLFDKPQTVQTINVVLTTEMTEGKNTSPTQVKKITLSDIGTLPPEESRDSGNCTILLQLQHFLSMRNCNI
jgi:hypothetical protein